MNDVDTLLLNRIKSREELGEPKVQLRPLLRNMGMEGYIKLCSRRIADAKLIDGKNIDIDIRDPYNLILTGDGILIASDILLGYCDEKKLRDVLSVLIKTRRLYRNINDQALMLSSLDNSTLRDMKKKRNAEEISSDRMNQVSKFAAAELEARRIYNVVLRKFSYSMYFIRAYLKCRCLLKIMNQIQHVE